MASLTGLAPWWRRLQADLTSAPSLSMWSQSPSRWSLWQGSWTSSTVAQGCKRQRWSCQSSKDKAANLCGITSLHSVAQISQMPAQIQREEWQTTPPEGGCVRELAALWSSHLEMLILLRVGVSKQKLESHWTVQNGTRCRRTGLEEPAPGIGWLAGLNEQGPVQTCSLQGQEMANAAWLRLALRAPGALPFPCSPLPLQLCLPSFIDAAVAEVLIYIF